MMHLRVSDGAINIAQVPNSDPMLPITISSVNDVTNPEYYIDNFNNNGICIDGYTEAFTAQLKSNVEKHTTLNSLLLMVLTELLSLL